MDLCDDCLDRLDDPTRKILYSVEGSEAIRALCLAYDDWVCATRGSIEEEAKARAALYQAWFRGLLALPIGNPGDISWTRARATLHLTEVEATRIIAILANPPDLPDSLRGVLQRLTAAVAQRAERSGSKPD